MRADIAEIFRLAAEFQIRRARVRAVGGNGDGGQIIFSVRQREAVAERAIGTQFDLMPAQSDLGIRLGRAVDDQLRIDVEPKTFLIFATTERTGKTGNAK